MSRPCTLAYRADLLRRAATLMLAHGIPMREVADPTNNLAQERVRLATFDGMGVVRVYDFFRSDTPLAQSLPGRQLEVDPSFVMSKAVAESFIEGAPTEFLRKAFRLASAFEPAPFLLSRPSGGSEVNPSRFIKWAYRPGVLSVHDAATGELLCESIAGQHAVLNERAFESVDEPLPIDDQQRYRARLPSALSPAGMP